MKIKKKKTDITNIKYKRLFWFFPRLSVHLIRTASEPLQFV